ncbi:MAG: hypothetical protein HDT43_08345, partial [Ruminococcaceae bacterium]|nr:hypothetical protein [Oscillospiraceae bacterium]
MKKLSKILSVGLSLVMCASLVAPSFAASFSELQWAIDTGESVYHEDGTTYKIEASKDDAGAVNVKLHEDVVFDADKDTASESSVEYEMVTNYRSNYTVTSGIVVDAGANVTIDLNGNDIDGDDKVDSVIKVNEGGELTLTDNSATGSAEEGTYESGAITGGARAGGVINEGTLTMDGGTIEDNTSTIGGGAGGVYNNGGTFTMNDGAIEDNTSSSQGAGGVYNRGEDSTFTMSGGAIRDNEDSSLGAGGVQNKWGEFTMTGGTIEGNKGYNGGGVWNNWYGEFNMSGDATIEGNVSLYSGGVLNGMQGSQNTDYHAEFNMSGDASITGNVGVCEGGGFQNTGGTVNMSGNASVTDNAGLRSGGASNRNGEITMTDNATIAGNTSTYGGGVVLDVLSTLTMDGNATIEKNTASLTEYLAIFEDIEVNTASKSFVNTYMPSLKKMADSGRGGGVYVVNTYVKLTMSGNAKIRNNTAAYMGDDICTIDPATVSLVEFNLIEDSQWKLDNPADREEGAEETMVLGQDTRGDVRWTAIPYMRDELNPNSKAYFYGLTFYEPNTPDPDPDPNPNPDPDPVIDPTPDPDPVPDP